MERLTQQWVTKTIRGGCLHEPSLPSVRPRPPSSLLIEISVSVLARLGSNVDTCQLDQSPVSLWQPIKIQTYTIDQHILNIETMYYTKTFTSIFFL